MQTRTCRLPTVKESENTFCNSFVFAVQQLVVKQFAGFKALCAALGFSFGIYSEQITGIVPKKVCGNPG